MRFGPKTRLRGAAAAAALAAAAVALAAGGASAQTSKPTEVLVSNTGIPTSDDNSPLWSQDLAQDFTTGSNPAGYRLSSITLSLTTAGSDIDVPSVKLARQASDGTGDVTLTGPASLNEDATQLYEFTAPADTILSASTQYWVVVQHGGPAGTHVSLNLTDAFDHRAADESVADVGWSIGDYTWSRDASLTGEFNWGGYVEPGQPSDRTRDASQAYLLSVKGSAVGGL